MSMPLASVPLQSPAPTEINGDTPTLRLFALLEVIASKSSYFTLQGLADETGLPKPTLHRMLQQLESAHLLERTADAKLYGTGSRLRKLAENLLINDTTHGARHAVLRQLVNEVGESCNLTALSGSEVIYLDRVETSAPLRFYLHPGSRVPASNLCVAVQAPVLRLTPERCLQLLPALQRAAQAISAIETEAMP